MRAWWRRDWWRSERGRDFARELALIVLGVLIALGIGEVADAVRWRVRVHHAAASMRTESAGNRFNAVERRLVAPCLERRLAEIDTVLRMAWRSGSLPPADAIGRPAARPFETAAWDVATADGTVAHMDRGDARDVALTYEILQVFVRTSEEERDLWDTLSMLEQPGGRADSNVLATLSEARARAAQKAKDVTTMAEQLDDLLAKHRVPVEWGKYGDLAGLIRNARSRPICQPWQVR